MDFTKIRVIVIDGGGKQPLAMVHGLKEIGCHVTVVCSSRTCSCYVSNKPDKKILSNIPLSDEDNMISFLKQCVSKKEYDVMMPIGEISTNMVTKHEDYFEKYVKLACAPREAYIKAFNKQITFDQASKSGIPCPYTRHSGQSIDDYLEKAKFPVIIKPRQGLGSIGFHKFKTKEEFKDRLNDISFNIDDYVVQEFVNFEHRVDANIFMDRKGNVCTSYSADVLRWFPIDAGAGVLIQTINYPDAIKYAGKLLHDMGWQGFANVTFMVDKDSGNLRLLEINGRIPASIKLAFTCGFNISKQFVEMVCGEDVTHYPENTCFGKFLRHFDTDIAWFIKSPDRFKTKPSWFSWKNTEEALFYKNDPKPFFYQFITKMFNYKEIMKKKSHK